MNTWQRGQLGPCRLCPAHAFIGLCWTDLILWPDNKSFGRCTLSWRWTGKTARFCLTDSCSGQTCSGFHVTWKQKINEEMSKKSERFSLPGRSFGNLHQWGWWRWRKLSKWCFGQSRFHCFLQTKQEPSTYRHTHIDCYNMWRVIIRKKCLLIAEQNLKKQNKMKNKNLHQSVTCLCCLACTFSFI